MTKSQRRRQNQENGRRSVGPITQAGKDKSRQNSLQHGFSAVQLSLPTEDPANLQAEADFWFEALEPVGHVEIDHANRLAVATIQLQRLAKAEASILSEQVRHANTLWDREQDLKFIEMKELLNTEPARAFVELKSISQGVEWLLMEWMALQGGFEMHGCLSNFESIRHGLRLQGFNPDRLPHESFRAHEFVVRALSCNPPREIDDRYRYDLLRALPLGHRYEGLHGKDRAYDRAESLAILRDWISEEILGLKQRLPGLIIAESDSRDTAETRAMAMEDTPKNRLIIRYSGSIQSGFDRTLKTVMKLKKVREEAAETEAEEEPKAESRNEPTIKAKSSSNPVHPGSYVTMNKRVYEVCDTGDGFIYLAPKEDERVSDDPADLEVVLEPLNDV